MNKHINGNVPEIPIFDDMFDVWVYPWWQSPWIMGTLIIVALLLFWGLLYLCRKKRQRIVILDPDQYAKDQLHRVGLMLEQSELDVHKLYTTLLLIIKVYLDQKYTIATCSKTESELYSYLLEHREQVPNVDDWLSLIHLIKNNAIIARFERNVVSKEVFIADYRAINDIIIRSKTVMPLSKK